MCVGCVLSFLDQSCYMPLLHYDYKHIFESLQAILLGLSCSTCTRVLDNHANATSITGMLNGHVHQLIIISGL